MLNQTRWLAEAQGHKLLLDVNSNTPGAPPIASAVDCCLACIGRHALPNLSLRSKAG